MYAGDWLRCRGFIWLGIILVDRRLGIVLSRVGGRRRKFALFCAGRGVRWRERLDRIDLDLADARSDPRHADADRPRFSRRYTGGRSKPAPLRGEILLRRSEINGAISNLEFQITATAKMTANADPSRWTAHSG